MTQIKINALKNKTTVMKGAGFNESMRWGLIGIKRKIREDGGERMVRNVHTYIHVYMKLSKIYQVKKEKTVDGVGEMAFSENPGPSPKYPYSRCLISVLGDPIPSGL